MDCFVASLLAMTGAAAIRTAPPHFAFVLGTTGTASISLRDLALLRLQNPRFIRPADPAIPG
jgi:hypothetical protein